MKKALPLIGIVALAGCNQGDDLGPPGIDIAEVCEDAAGAVEVVVTAGAGSEPVSQDLLVRGTALHTEALTIRKLLVAGVPAANDGFNFDAWSATVPLSIVRQNVDIESGMATLPIVATDACDRSSSSSFEVAVAFPVNELLLAVDYPGDETYLPADGTTAASIAVTADAGAAGAKVKLATTGSGMFQGTTGGVVTLAGDQSTPAQATVLFTSSTEGTAVVTASVDKLAAVLPVAVAGPPTLLPGVATLKAGQTISVSVTTLGRVKDCQATPAQGVSVTSGGTDLTKTPAAVDENGDGKPDIQIKADAGITGDAVVTILCRDPYGQSASGTYTASP